MINIKSK